MHNNEYNLQTLIEELHDIASQSKGTQLEERIRELCQRLAEDIVNNNNTEPNND